MTDCRTSKSSRSSKFLRHVKQHFNKNSESFDNGRVHPTFQGLPVPAPPPATSAATNVHASFPTPTPPWSQAWCTPGHADQEASGSNHTSKQNSDYFDALDTSEYLNQHQIPNYSELYGRQGNHQPGFEEQLACSFQDIRVSTTPTSHDQTYYPNAFVSETDLVSASCCDPVNEQYSNEHLFLDFDDATATSTQQSYGHGYGHGTMNQSCYLDFDDATATSTQQSYGHGYGHGTMNQSCYLDFDDATATSTQQSYGHGYGHGTMNQSCYLDFDDATATSTQQSYGHGYGHGTMNQSCYLDFDDATATSAQQSYGHGTMDQGLCQDFDDATTTLTQQQYEYGYGHGHGSLSMATGDTIHSGCSTMDTGSSSPPPSSSSYILQPVAAGRPSSIKRTFYNIYRDLRQILRGEELLDESGRRRRGFRVFGSMICIALRLKEMGATRTKSQESADKEIREPLCQLREQCTKMKKRKRAGESTASSAEHKYRGVTERNGKWSAEVRVSMVCKLKVWVGTYGSKMEAALAADAGLYHCSAKSKEYNFPQFVKDLGPSQYPEVQALCKSDQKHEAQELVKSLAKDHAAKFGSL